jgi:hypothetical protein
MRLVALTVALSLAACGGERDRVEGGADAFEAAERARAAEQPSEVPATRTDERVYVTDEEIAAARWSSERGQAVFGPRGGNTIILVRCEEDNEELVVTRSLPVGRDQRLEMVIAADDTVVRGYWRGLSDSLQRAMTRIPVTHPIVEALVSAEQITFRAEGFEDVVTPNGTVLQVVARRCTAAR